MADIHVAKLATLVKNKKLVLIGGIRRPDQCDAIREALQLKEFIWVETAAHKPLSRYTRFVFDAEVSVVLLAIRWSSHCYGEIGQICSRAGKPFVRLPGGYSVNQIAKQVLNQCGRRLGV